MTSGTFMGNAQPGNTYPAAQSLSSGTTGRALTLASQARSHLSLSSQVRQANA